MSRLVESIKVKDGKAYNLEYHLERMNRSRWELFGCRQWLEAKNFLDIPKKPGLFKCRVIYTRKIEMIEYVPYEFKKIHSLKLVVDNNIDYTYKYENKTNINRLRELRGKYDDILIVKNGLITDSSFANIIFYNGSRWLTPTKPLLAGTQRAYLLDTGKIKTADIKISDLKDFQQAVLINAMLDFDDGLRIEMENIGE